MHDNAFLFFVNAILIKSIWNGELEQIGLSLN